jgi:activator of HSP90 ATPase
VGIALLLAFDPIYRKNYSMAKTIVQKIVFKNTSPKVLFALYMNSKKHTIATAAPAKLSGKVGERFQTHAGYISGKNIHLAKDKLIVQSWRTKAWKEQDIDSTFILDFEPKGKNVVLHMIHANLPDEHAQSIYEGWYKHYWEPWKKYLAGKPILSHPSM